MKHQTLRCSCQDHQEQQSRPVPKHNQKKKWKKNLQNSIETLSNCSKNHTTALQTLRTRQNGSTVNKNEGVKLSSHEF